MPRKKPKDEKRIIPLHFATFGDMMMNMLTLFILLCSFAQDKNAEFFEAGRGSFIKAIESLGLPGVLPADDSAIQLDVHNDMHRSPMDPLTAESMGEERSYDSMEDIDLEEVLKEGEAWIPGSVLFARRSSRLSKEGESWLQEQLVYLQEGDFEIEVSGNVWQECTDEEEAWRISLKRSMRVIEYLNEAGGIPLERLHARAFGSTRPLAAGKRDPGMNRRVNIKLSKSR